MVECLSAEDRDLGECPGLRRNEDLLPDDLGV